MCRDRVMPNIFHHFLTVRKNVTEIFLDDYDVIDVFDNDRSAIMSRIDYVERHEPRR